MSPIGLYEWKVMCLGLANAPAEFARVVMSLLREDIDKFVSIYFDDMTIYSKTLEEHREHVSECYGF